MTDITYLTQELLEFIKEKRADLIIESDEESQPFTMTIAEPETEADEEYAQEHLDELLMDKADCESFLDKLEAWIYDNQERPTKTNKSRA